MSNVNCVASLLLYHAITLNNEDPKHLRQVELYLLIAQKHIATAIFV